MAGVPVDILFTSTDKRVNSTMLVEGGEGFKCWIKDNNSIIEPEILIHVEDPSIIHTWNYFSIPMYNNRKYFIQNIWSESSKSWWIKGKIDVLGTYRDDILKTEAFIMYAQSRYNSMLPDNRIQISDRSETHAVEQTIPWADEEGCYLLTIASKESSGKTGPAETYALPQSEMASISALLNSNNIAEQLLENFTGDPADAIVSCMWVPFNRAEISDGASGITPFGFPLGAGNTVKLQITGDTIIEPYIPYVSTYWNPETGAEEHGWADFRNVEPYTEYLLYLPGVGIKQIPMVNMIGYGKDIPKFSVQSTVSVPTGEVHYTVHRINDVKSGFTTPSTKVLDIKGNLGVSIPVSSRSGGFVTGLQHAVGMAVSIGLAIESGGSSGIAQAMYAGSAIESGVAATKNVFTQNTSVEGNLGGWLLDDEELTRIVCITRQFITSDSPSNLARVVGRPLFATCELGELKGFVTCSGAYVKAKGATQAEQEQLEQLINSSTNFIFGGVIIE